MKHLENFNDNNSNIKIGTKIIAVDVLWYDRDLTKGKEYICLDISGSKIVVLDDNNKKRLYYSSRFRRKNN